MKIKNFYNVNEEKGDDPSVILMKYGIKRVQQYLDKNDIDDAIETLIDTIGAIKRWKPNADGIKNPTKAGFKIIKENNIKERKDFPWDDSWDGYAEDDVEKYYFDDHDDKVNFLDIKKDKKYGEDISNI